MESTHVKVSFGMRLVGVKVMYMHQPHKVIMSKGLVYGSLFFGQLVIWGDFNMFNDSFDSHRAGSGPLDHTHHNVYDR